MKTHRDQVREKEAWMNAQKDPTLALEKFEKPLLAYLAGGLESENNQVKVVAARMLGALGDPAAVGFLKPLAAGSDDGPRAAAMAALRQLAVCPVYPVTGLESSPCRNCMIRLIAEESLASQKRSR